MRKVSVLCMIMLAAAICNAQDGLEIDHNTIYGKVKQVKIKTRTFSEKTGVIENTPYIVTYNKEGRKESMSSSKDGKKLFDEMYFYNKDGTVATAYRETGEGVKHTRAYKYVDGMLKELVDIQDGQEGSRIVYKNNAAGKPEYEWGYKKNVIENQVKYKYDPEGNCIERTNYKADGKTVTSKWTYSYDRHHNPVELKFIAGGKQTTIRYEYEYDKQFNWTKRSIYRNDKKESEDGREITYY